MKFRVLFLHTLLPLIATVSYAAENDTPTSEMTDDKLECNSMERRQTLFTSKLPLEFPEGVTRLFIQAGGQVSLETLVTAAPYCIISRGSTAARTYPAGSSFHLKYDAETPGCFFGSMDHEANQELNSIDCSGDGLTSEDLSLRLVRRELLQHFRVTYLEYPIL